MTIAEAERALRDAKIEAALAKNAKLIEEGGRCPCEYNHPDAISIIFGAVVGLIVGVFVGALVYSIRGWP